MPQTRRVALVTGSATGIGRACAIRFAERGLDVVVNYSRSEPEARETCEEVGRRGTKALLVRCDVGDDTQVREMFRRTQQELGRLDVLVNNAATTRFVEHTDLEALDEALLERIYAVNVKGPLYCCRAAVPIMKAVGGGAIVNVSSVAGLSGSGSSVPYAYSKGAVNTLTKSLAKAFAPEIRVNAVCPGPVLTRWLEPHMDHVERQMHLTPMKRAATPDDIAAAVVYLALDTGLTTGQLLILDGGRTM